MNTLIQTLKSLALASVCLMCLAIAQLAYKGTKTVYGLDTVLVHADATVQRSNLLIKNAQFLVLQAGLTANEARKASIKEVAILDSVNGQLQTTLADVDSFVVTSRTNEATVMATTTDTVRQIQPVLLQAQTTLESTNQVVKHIDTVVTDPSIPQTLHNVQESSQATEAAMQNVSTTTRDVSTVVHSYLHPTWPHRIADWTLKIVQALNPL